MSSHETTDGDLDFYLGEPPILPPDPPSGVGEPPSGVGAPPILEPLLPDMIDWLF